MNCAGFRGAEYCQRGPDVRQFSGHRNQWSAEFGVSGSAQSAADVEYLYAVDS